MNENVNNEEMDENSVSSDNSQELFNLIESIQTKLNLENTSTDNATNNNNVEDNNSNLNNNDSDSNINETVENTTKNIDDNNNSSDFSNIASLLQNIDLSTIINMFSSNKNSTNTTESQDFSNNSIFNGINPSTILKFQRVISSMNKSDPKKNLLLSLKPFLRKSRQDKLNEYITMLTIANAIEIFGSKGSDE